MKRKRVAASVLVLLLCVCSITAYAEPEEKVVTFSYETTDRNEQRPADETIADGDKTFALQKVTYDAVPVEPETETLTFEQVFEWSVTPGAIPETTEKDGITYRLAETRELPETKTGRVMSAETTLETQGELPPETASVTVYDELLKQNVTGSIPLVSTVETDGIWEPWSFQISIRNPDATFYRMNGRLIRMGELPGADDYPAIIEGLGVETETHRIASLSWGGVVNGEQIINGTGEAMTRTYAGSYAGDVRLPDAEGKTVTAVYEAQVTKEAEQKYTVTATATYVFNQVSFWQTTTGRVVMAAGVLLFVILLVAVLLILAKKRRIKEG